MPQQTHRPYPLEAFPPTPESLAALTQRNIELRGCPETFK